MDDLYLPLSAQRLFLAPFHNHNENPALSNEHDLELLEHGKERLLVAVERGVIPANIAMEIARAPDGDVQEALAEAYEA